MAKFKKINFKSKSLWKKIGLGVLAGVVLIGAVFGVTALFRKAEEETQKEISPTYAIGGLTETGAYLETKESIYTKDAFECYGLKTSLEFDNNISYKLYFYNENNEFIESTEKLTTTFDSAKTNMPAFTKYCRVVITPNEDSKISWYEKNGYAKQLTIEVNKEQSESAGVEIALKNYFEVDSDGANKVLTADSSGNVTYIDSASISVSKPVDVSGYSDCKIKVVFNSPISGVCNSYFVDSNWKKVSSTNFTEGLKEFEYEIHGTANFYLVCYKTDNPPSAIYLITD